MFAFRDTTVGKKEQWSCTRPTYWLSCRSFSCQWPCSEDFCVCRYLCLILLFWAILGVLEMVGITWIQRTSANAAFLLPFRCSLSVIASKMWGSLWNYAGDCKRNGEGIRTAFHSLKIVFGLKPIKNNMYWETSWRKKNAVGMLHFPTYVFE